MQLLSKKKDLEMQLTTSKGYASNISAKDRELKLYTSNNPIF